MSSNCYLSHQVRLVACEGKLVAEDAEHRLPRGDYQSVGLTNRIPCERAFVMPAVDFFIPERANSPFPLRPGQQSWVEVTVPPSGPPRAIQLAVNGNGTWRVLRFD